MQTDEQFTDQLSQAFRSSTNDLTYSGRVPTPSRPMLAVAPAAVVGVAGISLAVAVTASHADGGQQHAAFGPGDHPHGTQVSPHHAGSAQQLVLRNLRLAGYTLRDEGAATGYYARVVDKVPDGAKPADDDAPGVKAYIGVDPTTGLQTAYVVGDEHTIAITSPNASVDQLKSMLTGGDPKAVPLVTSP